MEIIFEIAKAIGVSILGILLYTFIEARDHFRPRHFSLKIFFDENIYKWIYSVCVCLIIATIINVVPNSAEAIQTSTGLAVGAEIASFLTLGYSLSASFKKDKKEGLRKDLENKK